MFEEQVAALRDRYRCLSWDVRGHGHSLPMGAPFSLHQAVDDLRALLDYAGIERAALVGQSMGGNMSQAFLARYGERVRTLALIDCVCNTFPLTVAERWALRLTPAMLRLYPRATLLRQSAQVVGIRPHTQAYMFETMNALSNAEIAEILGATLGALHPDPTYRMPLPFLLLRGDHDTAGAIARQAPRWAALDSNCHYVVVPDAGHLSNMDNPEFVNAELRRWLDARA